MPNSNCLAGVQCPKCRSLGPFKIEAKALFEVHDDGTESYGDVEWEDSSFILCENCEHSGTVGAFKALKSCDPENREETLAAFRLSAAWTSHVRTDLCEDPDCWFEDDRLFVSCGCGARWAVGDAENPAQDLGYTFEPEEA